MSELLPTPGVSPNAIFPDGNGLKFLSERGSPPPWRQFQASGFRGKTHVVNQHERDAIKAAFYLRRPLLITGDPGVGKSSLAYAIAHELELGKVLVWPITSRTTLQHGLYSYDAVGRLNQVSLEPRKRETESREERIGDYLNLGPLGSALYDSTETKPRILLIDELDKSDVDLPNDLLHVLEEGGFIIPELSRLKVKTVRVPLHSGERSVEILNGEVQATGAPFILMTSNGEREFPPAFLRRCLRLEIKRPTREDLEQIVCQKLGEEAPVAEKLNKILELFLSEQEQNRKLATDQLLNAAFLVAKNRISTDKEELLRLIFQPLQ